MLWNLKYLFALVYKPDLTEIPQKCEDLLTFLVLLIPVVYPQIL